MRNINVGYLNFLGKKHISAVTINEIILTLLARYVNVKILPAGNLEDAKRIFREIDKHKLDYLYVDSYTFLFHSFLLREKFQLDIPFILNIHTICGWVYPQIFLIPLIRKYDIIFAPSEYAKESFSRISDRFNVHVIPRFLDMKFIRNNISHNFRNDNKKVITFMGRLMERKGIRTLIECMPRVIARVRNAHLNIIGPLSGVKITDYPKSAFVKKLEKIVRRLKIADRVHFKGVQTGLNKYKILSESDVFVNPTLAPEETFSIVNIEALACGLPVIATRWAGNKEIILEGKNGFLVDVKYDKNREPRIDIEGLVSSIVKVLKDRELNLKMKKNSLKAALRYDYRKVLPRLTRLLKKKRRQKSKNKWGLIKNKRVIDFRHLFNEKFFFFIYCVNLFRKETYFSLYKECFSQAPSKKRRDSNIRKKINRENAKNTKKFKRFGQDFSDYLLLKSE